MFQAKEWWLGQSFKNTKETNNVSSAGICFTFLHWNYLKTFLEWLGGAESHFGIIAANIILDSSCMAAR